MPEASATVVAPPVSVIVAPLPSDAGEMAPEILHSPGVKAKEKVLETPPAVAVRMAVCAVATATAVAVKLALDAAAGTVTDAGTVTLVLLLARVTGNPPAAATALSVTVQAATPGEPMLAGVHVNPLKTGLARAVKFAAVRLAPATVRDSVVGVKVEPVLLGVNV